MRNTKTQIKNKLSEILNDLYLFDNNQKIKTYNKQYFYSDPFDYSFNKIASTPLKKLSCNLIDKNKNIIYSDQIVDYVFEKYGLTMNEIGDLLTDKVLKFYEEEVKERSPDTYQRKMENLQKLLNS